VVKKDESLLPWEDEEGRKRKAKRGDGIPPKTNIQSRVHSKPKTDGQDYLDMYIRSKEKERTERYGEILGKQLKDIAGTWKDIKKDMIDKERTIPRVSGDDGDMEKSEDQKNKNKEVKQKKKVPDHLKKMDWSY